MRSKFKNWIIYYKTPLIHILVWAVLLLLPKIFSYSDFRNIETHTHERDTFSYLNVINRLLLILVFYTNTQILIPKLLYSKKYIFFFLSQLGVFTIILIIDYCLFYLLAINHNFHFIKAINHNIGLFILTVLGSITFKTFWDKQKADYIDKERQTENLKTELSFLRSQISPHFIFNVLNNIVAMVRFKSDKVEDTVVKLSALLQYMLYETDEEKVLVQNEVTYLKSYIDLQSQRFGNKIQVITQFDAFENGNLIEPMLLIPFVENAFKHGYGLIQNPIIEINLKCFEQQLFFEVKNKYNPHDHQKDKSSGIGLGNVKRRLELLYPNRYNLKIEQNQEWFIVKLKLELKP
jgi:two-component system, LytTR family, sensor kinase